MTPVFVEWMEVTLSTALGLASCGLLLVSATCEYVVCCLSLLEILFEPLGWIASSDEMICEKEVLSDLFESSHLVRPTDAEANDQAAVDVVPVKGM